MRSSPIAALLALLTLLAAIPAASEPSPFPSCESGVRHIELAADAGGKAIEVCIRPGLTTTLLFDSKLARVTLERRERFQRIMEGRDFLALVPSESLPDGARITVMVYFGEGAAPSSATFELVVHPSQAERQVEVSRHQRLVASYQQEVQQARAEAQQCQEEKAQLQSECGGRVGLRGLIAHGLVGEGGVRSRDLRREAVVRPGDTLGLTEVRSYRSSTRRMGGAAPLLRLALELELENRGPRDWTAVGAALVGSKGEVLRVLEVWQSEPLPPGKRRTVVVEVEATEREVAQGPFTLKLWAGEGGAGSLMLGGVTFP